VATEDWKHQPSFQIINTVGDKNANDNPNYRDDSNDDIDGSGICAK
jgi:hypothetical protein